MANEHALTIWRKTKKLSQEELAEKLGVTRWMINRIETGNRRPSWQLAAKISEFTSGKVTANDFASREAQQ